MQDDILAIKENCSNCFEAIVLCRDFRKWEGVESYFLVVCRLHNLE